MLEPGALLVAWGAVAGEGAAAVVTELALPAVDELGSDAEVAGGLRDVAEAGGEADGLALVLGGEGRQVADMDTGVLGWE